MRLYPIKRYFRIKRLVLFLVVFLLISIGMKMGELFKWRDDIEFQEITVKRYELYKYNLESFAVGSYLRDSAPGNISYCNFRLGDSETFNFTESDISYSPELGNKGPYRVLYSVVKGHQFNSSLTNTVTYATHVSLKYLFHIVEIVRRWEGPVSVGCFLPGTDAILALKVLEKMCLCVKEMENANVHFIYHKNHPPKQMSLKNYSMWLDIQTEVSYTPWRIVSSEIFQSSSGGLPLEKNDESKATPKTTVGNCYVPEKVLKNSYRCKNELAYPVNVARNVARTGSRSKYVLVSDVELLPSENLVTEFLKMIDRLKEKSRSLGDNYFTRKKHVFVLPIFEVAGDLPDVPRTKKKLLELLEREKAVYFHKYFCPHCQRFPGLQKWIQKKVHPLLKRNIIQPFLVVKREFPYHRWEPIYIGTNDEPLYSELLTWEGVQEKMTQMDEMCLQEYQFVILNGAFLVHTPGIKINKYNSNFISAKIRRNKTFTSTTEDTSFNWRNEHIKRNAHLYRVITKDLLARYRFNSRCKIQ